MKVRDWFNNTRVQNHPTWLRRMIQNPFSVPPIFGDISVAGGCNHRCLHCSPSILGYRHNYLGLPVFTRFFREVSEMRSVDPDGLGIRNLHFAGEGEPMLEKELGKIFEQARLVGIDVGMLSNGVALTEKRAYEILPFINSYFQFSINAGKMDSYTNFHQTDSTDWPRVWSNIQRGVRIKQELKSDCAIGVNMTVTIRGAINNRGIWVPPNWPEAEALIQKARDAGVDYVCFKPYSQLPQNRQKFEIYGDMVYESMMDQIIETGAMLRERYETDDFEVIFRFDRFKEYDLANRGYPTCHSTPTMLFYMQADGLVLSCQNYWLKAEEMSHWRQNQFYLGNINEQSFKEIWYGDRRRQNLESMKTFDVSACRRGCIPNKDNRYLYWLLHLAPMEQETELSRLETDLAVNGFPRLGKSV